MSLSKRLCVRCISAFESDMRGAWDHADEDVWQIDRIVMCPWEYGYGGDGETDEDPPEWCPYFLEHVLDVKPDGGQTCL